MLCLSFEINLQSLQNLPGFLLKVGGKKRGDMGFCCFCKEQHLIFLRFFFCRAQIFFFASRLMIPCSSILHEGDELFFRQCPHAGYGLFELAKCCIIFRILPLDGIV